LLRVRLDANCSIERGACFAFGPRNRISSNSRKGYVRAIPNDALATHEFTIQMEFYDFHYGNRVRSKATN